MEFHVDASNFRVLYEPNEFYEELLRLTRTANDRVVLAALYVGSGYREKSIIESIDFNRTNNPKLKVHIISDINRGTRNREDVEMLTELVKESPVDTNTSVSFVTTPTSVIGALLRKTLPPRLREVLGVFHLKIYLADDTVILTGANLCDSYLTDRQDRYIVVTDKALADRLYSVAYALECSSYQLGKDGELHLPQGVPNPTWEPTRYKSAVQRTIDDVLFASLSDSNYVSDESKIWPTCQNQINDVEQLTRIKILLQAPFISKKFVNEQNFLRRLFNRKEDQHPLILASAYPQIAELYKRVLAPRTGKWLGFFRSVFFKAKCCLLHMVLKRYFVNDTYNGVSGESYTKLDESNKSGSFGLPSFWFIHGSPNTNSFFESKGLSRYVPGVYSYACCKLVNEICKSQKEEATKSPVCVDDNTEDLEYDRNSWTFHTKGVWIFPKTAKFDLKSISQASSPPIGTIIGSSNYNERSVARDLDMSFFIYTNNKCLRGALHHEVLNTLKYCRSVSREYLMRDRLPVWVRCLANTAAFKSFL